MWCLYRMTFPAISKDFLGKFCFLLRQGQKKWAWCYVNLPPGQDFCWRMGPSVQTAWRHPAHPLFRASALPTWDAPLQPLPTGKLWTWKTAWADHKSFDHNRLISKMGMQTLIVSIYQSCVRVNERMSESPLKSVVPCVTSIPCLDHVPRLGWAQTTSQPQL